MKSLVLRGREPFPNILTTLATQGDTSRDAISRAVCDPHSYVAHWML